MGIASYPLALRVDVIGADDYAVTVMSQFRTTGKGQPNTYG
jgi:hypothetical protein